MTLANLYTNEMIISRLTVTSGNKSAYVTLTSENCNIQRLREETAIKIGGAIGKTFRLYCDEGVDIQKGDKLKDEDGNEYKVEAVTVPAELGSFVHYEAIITLVK
jgi:hypothetical protein